MQGDLAMMGPKQEAQAARRVNFKPPSLSQSVEIAARISQTSTDILEF
tara:strand:+ start:282 stop:425 length:144 start_codon:yes stop_codon:yes gene_type:complete